MAAREHAARLQTELRTQLRTPVVRAESPETLDVPAERDWVESGGAALTGRADGAPMSVPGAPASALRGALAVLAAETGHHSSTLPGVGLVGERAELLGLGRNGRWSCGGRFRGVRAVDGWAGLSIARDEDVAAIPALVGHDGVGDPWAAVDDWAANRPTDEVVERARLLGLAAATIPRASGRERRPPVVVRTLGRAIRLAGAPRVVDLSALWAGPLCARLLRAAGAHVTTVENAARPDPGRRATPNFYERLHDGCVRREMDFARDRGRLRELVADADVVITASRFRALARLGLDPHREARRGAVWVHISAYGTGNDVDAERIGFGDDVAAGAGLVAWSDPGSGATPLPAADALADPLSGAFAAAAAAATLRAGRGALLDVSMHDVCLRALASRGG